MSYISDIVRVWEVNEAVRQSDSVLFVKPFLPLHSIYITHVTNNESS